MKKALCYGIIISFAFSSCEKNDPNLFFKVGDDLKFRFSDIELYDTSTHIIYFKNEYAEFENLLYGSFSFLDNGDPIYSGSLWPEFSSLGPTNPFIATPPMYGNFALRIDSWSFDDPDVRNNPRIIQLLNQNDLLHSGLAISACAVDITETQLIFRFTISNQDHSALLIIDPDKTGANLFHAFTNGLYIYDLADNETFSSTIQPQVPDPINAWEMDWLTELESGNSKDFTLNYPLSDPLATGEYYASFEFPGLSHQLTKDQLYQGNARIWLGGVTIRKRIIVP